MSILLDHTPIYANIPKDRLIVLLKAFFDGGNEADSTQYEVVSLASIAGTPGQWRRFDADWKINLKKHHAPFLHTTDALTFNEPFTRDRGWNEQKVDNFLSDCAKIIDHHLLRPTVKNDPGREGLMAHVVTIVLKDFIRARGANPKVPKDATVLCATQSVATLLVRGANIGVHAYHLFFDQNEPFMGHIYDRQHNRKAKQHLKPFAGRISEIAERDMRDVPALQAADLFAWSYSHKKQSALYEWQNILLLHRRWVDDWYEYDALVNVIPGVAERVQSWKLPPRKPTR
ncbi:MAG TPA: hypothetical protein VGN17_03740 [Bryobacteraceae bacterium]